MKAKLLLSLLISLYSVLMVIVCPLENKGSFKAFGATLGQGDTPYITFKADATQTLNMSKAVETLEYSVNGGAWQELGTNTVTFGGLNGDLRLRGKNPYGTTDINYGFNYSKISFSYLTPVECSGDIRTLVDYENYETVDTKNARFSHLFYGCTTLTTAPALPATTLASRCYENMFHGCSSLTVTPILPATNLDYACYECMFWGCTSLTTSPILPATNLDMNCYTAMFKDCTALTTAPALPVTTLADYCYSQMFEGCTSLTTAPALPATTLNYHCYFKMFEGCTSLTTAPALPATTLATNCCQNMFSECTSLTTAPELPATTLAEGCYKSMFFGCTSLTTAPELPATTLADYCYQGMFYCCNNLNYVKMLAIDISAEACLQNWLSGASSGIFVKNACATWSNEDIVPEGWTVMIDGIILIETVTLNKVVMELVEEETETLIATITPDNASDKSVTWSSSNTNAATVDSNGKVTAIAAGTATITATANDGSGKSASCTVTVNAIPASTYKLTYQIDGETYKEYNVEEGAAIIPEAEPTKTGYTFSGWSDIPSTMPAEDVIITAKWTINSYKLTYKVDNEAYKESTVEYNSAISPLAAPEKEGYTFSGWSEIPKNMPANDVVVTGSFTINQYTVKFVADGVTIKEDKFDYGSAITAPANPTKDGSVFKGWNPEVDKTVPSHDVTYTALFESVSGIDDIFLNAETVKVHSIIGQLIKSNATKEDVNSLPSGIYIINGKKVTLR